MGNALELNSSLIHGPDFKMEGKYVKVILKAIVASQAKAQTQSFKSNRTEPVTESFQQIPINHHMGSLFWNPLLDTKKLGKLNLELKLID